MLENKKEKALRKVSVSEHKLTVSSNQLTGTSKMRFSVKESCFIVPWQLREERKAISD